MRDVDWVVMVRTLPRFNTASDGVLLNCTLRCGLNGPVG